MKTRTFNFFFESQCRHTRKYAKALGKNPRSDCTAPPGQRNKISTDKKTASASPIKDSDCGDFKMNDFVSAGSEQGDRREVRNDEIKNG
jgi:hypothetical protein